MCCIHSICILAPSANVSANMIFHPVISSKYIVASILTSDLQHLQCIWEVNAIRLCDDSVRCLLGGTTLATVIGPRLLQLPKLKAKENEIKTMVIPKRRQHFDSDQCFDFI